VTTESRDLADRFFKRTGRMPNMTRPALFGDAAVPEGRQGRRHQGPRSRRQKAQGTSGRRSVRARRQGAQKMPQWCTTSIVRGQEAVESKEPSESRSPGITTSSSPWCRATSVSFRKDIGWPAGEVMGTSDPVDRSSRVVPACACGACHRPAGPDPLARLRDADSVNGKSSLHSSGASIAFAGAYAKQSP